MNLEIKEKYNDFIKIIDKKEIMDKIVWLEQYNKNNPSDPIKPVNFNDLRMKNIIKRRPSVKDSLIAIGVSFLANITNKFKLK
jgi:hypothetical protein